MRCPNLSVSSRPSLPALPQVNCHKQTSIESTDAFMRVEKPYQPWCYHYGQSWHSGYGGFEDAAFGLDLRCRRAADPSLCAKGRNVVAVDEQRYRIQNRGWIWMDTLLWLHWYILILLFLRLLVGSTASGRPLQGVGYVCQCTDLPASTKSMSPFGQGSGPVYVVIANMKLVALLCIGWHSKLPDPGHKKILQNCVNWDGLRSPYLFDWINLDICGILWLWYTEQINQGCRCSHVSDLLWAVAFFAMASLDGLLRHCETLWHEMYDTSSACCFSLSFFGGRLHICAMVKKWMICLYLYSLYILSMYLYIWYI